MSDPEDGQEPEEYTESKAFAVGPTLAAICRTQALSIAACDPGGDDIMAWLESVEDWPED